MKRFLHTSMLIGFFLIIGFNVKTYSFKPGRYNVGAKPKLTAENLYNELVWQGIKHHDIVFRQAMLETMWLKCKSCSMNFNNLFGFKTSEYLRFEHWTESVAYYKQWQDKLYKGGDYYQFITRIGYATAPNYIQALKTMDKRLLNGIQENAITVWK